MLAVAAMVLAAGCTPKGTTFGNDVTFLEKHTDAFVLSGEGGQAQVAVVPQYQGRVMTSTAGGAEGLSFGWINYSLVRSGYKKKHMNPFGGEDRMWLGPEGGQYSIFFKEGAPFDLEHWQTPDAIDWDPWAVVEKDATSAHFRKPMSLTNYAGFRFDLLADRFVRLLGPEDVKTHFGVDLPAEVKAVAYESDNRIKNTGRVPWKKETGLLSIWMLCMYNPSPATVAVLPFKEGPEEKLGRIVNDAYFGEVPPDRLLVRDGVIFFKCDGKHRSKIGIGPKRAKPIIGSYDAANCVLTLCNYTKPEGVTDYVNSMWEIQEHPYGGDVVNSYNDGPAEDGSMLGPFYELESSSPAATLKPGETLKHVHRTLHIQGRERDLDPIAQAALGVSLEEIQNAFAE
jgi:hypothetical protein